MNQGKNIKTFSATQYTQLMRRNAFRSSLAFSEIPLLKRLILQGVFENITTFAHGKINMFSHISEFLYWTIRK